MKNRCVKKFALVLIVVSILLLSACNKNSNNVEFTNADELNNVSYISDFSCIYEHEDTLYYACDFGTSNLYISFLNRETGKTYPLCSRPECMHQNSKFNGEYLSEDSCNACIGDSAGVGGTMFQGLVAVYDGYVYTIGTDFETRSVIRISLDGSKKEKVVDIGNYFIEGSEYNHGNGGYLPDINRFNICNDALYFYVHTNNFSLGSFDSDDIMASGRNVEVYKVNLKGTPKLEKIFYEPSDPQERYDQVSGLYYGKDSVYLQIKKIYSMEDVRADIYKLNTECNGFDLLKSDVKDYVEFDSNKKGYYYSDGDKLMFTSFDSDQTQLVYTFDEVNQDMIFQCIVYGDYLFLNRGMGNTVYIYNIKENKLVRTIEFESDDKNKAAIFISKIENGTIYINFFSPTQIDGKSLMYAYASIEDVINSKETWNKIAYEVTQ